MEQEVQHEEIEEFQQEVHEHARVRLALGITVVVLLGVFFFYVWPRWGEDIKETCLGDGEVCAVPLPGATIGDTQE